MKDGDTGKGSTRTRMAIHTKASGIRERSTGRVFSQLRRSKVLYALFHLVFVPYTFFFLFCVMRVDSILGSGSLDRSSAGCGTSRMEVTTLESLSGSGRIRKANM